MCGFIGYVHDQILAEERPIHTLFKHINEGAYWAQEHERYFEDDEITFGFRKLTTNDLETERHVHFYENNRYVTVFDGTIYNLNELVAEFDEMVFFSTNAEVITSLYQENKEKMLDKLRGMFAFMIFDKKEKLLFGARDIFGIKPFFYKEGSDHTFFASEKKSILHAIQDKSLNIDAIQHYLTFQFVPEPETMTKGIKKLEPGHYFFKKLGEPMQISRFWKASFQSVQNSESQYIREIRDVLFESVQFHMRGNASIGSFLSGGIDSSLIVAIAKEYHPKLKTFSVGFEREGFSEIDIAKETADKLGVENHSYVISPEQYMREIREIIRYLEDPLADPACVPLYFVAREAKKHVKVALSGEGSDELFGGYNIYREPQSLSIFNRIPKIITKLLRLLAMIIPEGVRGKSFIERGSTPLEERYIGNAKIFSELEKQKLFVPYHQGTHYTDITKALYMETNIYNPVERMQYVDIHTWMRGDILLKADKMTRAHSLELRVPFLDKEVFAVASKIPTNLKLKNRTTKYILRLAAKGIVPDHVLDRKKLGFPVPIRHWLKEEMYEWVIHLIKYSPTEHIVDKTYILKLLENHCQGKSDYSRKIWTVVIFMIWHSVFMEGEYGDMFEERVAIAHT